MKGRSDGVYSIHFHGFVYTYDCSECKRAFNSTAPELNDPVLCENCFHGKQPALIKNRFRKNRRKVKKVEDED